METTVILSRTFSSNGFPFKKNSAIVPASKLRNRTNMTMDFKVAETATPKNNFSYLADANASRWNHTELFYNATNGTDSDFFDSDYKTLNATNLDDGSWNETCKEWNPTQHGLFQTANFFFAVAFLVPGSFKQSVLLVRGLLSIGYFFLTIWGGVAVCASDILLWNLMIVILNAGHTALLTWKFLPPTLTLDLTELYLKVFKPLRVNKKHFKELVKEAKVMNLEEGDIYAVEDVSPADERLSILLNGRLRVTCDDTHLHFIGTHQFVDSPEWEANHEQSDDVFQVTITAEEDSVYLCWPRMKLERVLRHRPMLKVVFDAVIGKDITQKLYALNEHLSGLSDERQRGQRDQLWAKTHSRSMSMDAVNTGTTGLVRSQAYKQNHKNNSVNADTAVGTFNNLDGHRQSQQTWIPLVAKQFPAKSPFHPQNSTTSLRIPEVHTTPVRSRSLRRSTREVKFETGKRK